MAFGRKKLTQQTDPGESLTAPAALRPIKQVTAKYIKERYDYALKATIYERRDYWINYAFLRGKQWVYWNRVTRRIDDVVRTRGRYQATIDRLSPSSRTLMAKMTERELAFEVPPKEADDSSIMGARTAEAILRSISRDHKWEQLREELAWAAWIGGTAALCIDWDPDAGYELPGEDATDPLHTGDICETVLTIPEFVIEPGARDGETARWGIKALILPPQTVQSMYPDQWPDNPPPSDASSSGSPYNQRIITTDDQAMNLTSGTIVLTYYERPNPMNPKGCVAVVVDGRLMDNKDWPYPWKDRLPFVIVKETPVNSRWTGETILSKAAKVQVALNAAWSNYLEHLKKVGNARLMLPASQMDNADALNDDPGKPLKFLDGPGSAMPAYLQPPNLPPWIINIIQELRSEMDTIMGMSDVTRGMAPSNAPDSGVGFQILSENADTPTGRGSKEQARAWGQFGSFVLQLLEDNVSETHTAVVTMPKQPPMTVPWTGKTLAGQTTAIVPTDSIIPRSRAALQQLANSLVQQGFIRPGDFATFARVADLPGFDNLLDAVDYKTALAMRYCAYMAEGQAVIPEPWHDAQIMIDEINRFRCSPRFEQLDPKIKNLFATTAKAYETLATETMANRFRQQMTPGMPQLPDANGTPPLGMPAGSPGGATPPQGPGGSPGGMPQQAPPQGLEQQPMPPVGG